LDETTPIGRTNEWNLQLRNEKNGFVMATKLGTTNIFFFAATKNFAAATIRFFFFERTKHFVVKKYFCYPYFNK